MQTLGFLDSAVFTIDFSRIKTHNTSVRSPFFTKFKLKNLGVGLDSRFSSFSVRSIRVPPRDRQGKSLVEDDAEVNQSDDYDKNRVMDRESSSSTRNWRHGDSGGFARIRSSGSHVRNFRVSVPDGSVEQSRGSRDRDSGNFSRSGSMESPVRKFRVSVPDGSVDRSRGSGDGFSPPGKRGGKDSGLSYRKGGDLLREGKDSGRRGIRILNDEDDDGMPGLEGGLGSRIVGEEGFDKDLVKDSSSMSELDDEGSSRPIPRNVIEDTESYLTQTRFDQCPISPLSLKGISAAGYERMTVVQEATLPAILKGKDVLAKAKTGTGKTVAFLLPAIEAIIKSPPSDRDQKRPPINVLVICPTRELAIQAAAEAHKLLKYHPSIGVQVTIGGTRITLEQKHMQANPCHILVATPGRLRDHIENTEAFVSRLMGVKVLVLDEADHLLDMGFRQAIEKIISFIPKQRQTLLFSATVPQEVKQICHIALKRDHEFINTVEEGDEETHSQVGQMHLVAPLDKHFPILYSILTKHISEDVEYKVLVFCTTAMVTKLVANLLSVLNFNVREIHSRKSQSYRTKVSDEFRNSKGLILVTSDVSARGVDYPDVTFVVQVGLPSDREQYIHRLGRTGRKGKEGKGLLLLAPWEEFFLGSVKDLPITKVQMSPIELDTRKKVEQALCRVEMKNKEVAYQAWLGYYNSDKNVGRDKVRLVELANEFSRSMGLDSPPAIPKQILGKMGLRNVPGLVSK